MSFIDMRNNFLTKNTRPTATRSNKQMCSPDYIFFSASNVAGVPTPIKIEEEEYKRETTDPKK